MNLKGRSFLKLRDFTAEEILYLVDLAEELKEKRKRGIKGHSLQGKNIALIFEKPSTRTRCAFTIGAQDEGATATYLAGSELQLGEKESIEGVNIAIAAPKRLWPDADLVEECRGYAKEAGSVVEVSDELDVVEGADMLYTDVWFSMGEEKKEQERTKLALPYQVNAELMKRTGKDTTLFSHCLPANKGKEVTEDVFESEKSVVFDEAENRLHTIKAIMVATLGE